ncbi:hypothetical protein SARC_00045 [Sphaeroforma arctica JP610]|uniref:Uncharacterized protein n=1 Tax=Sphaeroforma arctica JP610 TaxID=667725 RepID=A0A0L0GFI1_9EUKA|nr:hypothetical protein SARC_00045 [Sphaeroforma arctica JP610]KNC87787.1 hypothetical protein SARC_00045 [Sphaeroforma arctica JP610]|eukprot:XP_014161689.1 hypothetical protein SARC_00045 [Sphaeroforma arctica JP610]
MAKGSSEAKGAASSKPAKPVEVPEGTGDAGPSGTDHVVEAVEEAVTELGSEENSEDDSSDPKALHVEVSTAVERLASVRVVPTSVVRTGSAPCSAGEVVGAEYEIPSRTRLSVIILSRSKDGGAPMPYQTTDAFETGEGTVVLPHAGEKIQGVCGGSRYHGSRGTLVIAGGGQGQWAAVSGLPGCIEPVVGCRYIILLRSEDGGEPMSHQTTDAFENNTARNTKKPRTTAGGGIGSTSTEPKGERKERASCKKCGYNLTKRDGKWNGKHDSVKCAPGKPNFGHYLKECTTCKGTNGWHKDDCKDMPDVQVKH